MTPDPDPRVAPARWKVLIVDDEPSVHEMSRLILSGLTFEGRDVELISAGSAAQAREILARHRDVALALLDVVMETDDAGIALVRHIREQLADPDMQIVLRTGQPGMAPEGEIMRRYEINGYFLKTEITAQRLHSIVISGLRGWRHARGLRGARADERRVQARSTGRDAARDGLAGDIERAHDAASVLMQAQPEVALASNEVTGIELVPQWRTPAGLLPATRVGEALHAGPARLRINRWLLAQACAWAASWRTALERPLHVSIPLVGDGLGDDVTLEAVLAAARDAALAPGTLDLLVSEATLLSGEDGIRIAVDAVRAAGVTITLVDFGARTVSLQRLNQLVPDRVKLHRLFVRGVTAEAERIALARSLIALAQTLDIVSVADGISSDADAQFFKWEGCDLGQGDALAAACAPEQLVDTLLQGRLAAH